MLPMRMVHYFAPYITPLPDLTVWSHSAALPVHSLGNLTSFRYMWFAEEHAPSLDIALFSHLIGSNSIHRISLQHGQSASVSNSMPALCCCSHM